MIRGEMRKKNVDRHMVAADCTKMLFMIENIRNLVEFTNDIDTIPEFIDELVEVTDLMRARANMLIAEEKKLNGLQKFLDTFNPNPITIAPVKTDGIATPASPLKSAGSLTVVKKDGTIDGEELQPTPEQVTADNLETFLEVHGHVNTTKWLEKTPPTIWPDTKKEKITPENVGQYMGVYGC